MPVIKSTNILTDHWLNMARDKNTHPEQFRTALENVGLLLFLEAISDIRSLIVKKDIKTPLKKIHVSYIEQKNIYITPILRAGLAMLSSVRNFVPVAKVAHVGLYRNERTLQPHWYLDKLPRKITKRSAFFVLEPMLATGGTICEVLNRLYSIGASKIYVLSAIISEHAKNKLENKYKDVNFLVAGVDKQLNQKGYIVPGLGDAGDRAFNM